MKSRFRCCLLLFVLMLVSICLYPNCAFSAGDSKQKSSVLLDKNLVLAINAHHAGQFKEAEHYYQLALQASKSLDRKDVRVGEVLARFAQLYMDWGMDAEACQLLNLFIENKKVYLLKKYDGLPWKVADLADCYYNLRDWKQAIFYYDDAVITWHHYRRWPDSIASLCKQAECYKQLNDYVSARQILQRAIQLSDKALAMPAIGSRRILVEIDRANALYHVETFRRREDAAVIRAQANGIWQNVIGLTAQTFSKSETLNWNLVCSDTPTEESQLKALERLASFYCRSGKFTEAELVLEMVMQHKLNHNEKDKANKAYRGKLVADFYKSLASCRQSTAKLITAKERPGSNLYLREFVAIKDRQEYFDKRPLLPHKYSWGIPNQEALNAVQRYQPIIEIGAGTGYWAYLLRQMGTKVAAYDLNPVPSKDNLWHYKAEKSWSQVLEGDQKMLETHPGYTLLLCWPPDAEPFAYNTLLSYKGDRFIYVGEGPDGWTGSESFFNLLKKEWQLEKKIEIPQWTGAYDSLYIYARKAKSK